MPTYEYECTECGHAFEKSQQMTAKPLAECPECGGKLKRLIGTGAGVILKGDGARATDSGSNRCCGDSPCCGRDTSCDTPPCGS